MIPLSDLYAAFKIMEVSHELIRTGRQATQRDIYYKVIL